MKSQTVILIVVSCAFLAALAQLLFKFASEYFSFNPISWLNVFFISGLVIYAAVFFIFVWALKFGSVSILYPIMASSYVFVCFLAYFFLNESITLLRLLGIGLIIVGIGAITKSKEIKK